MSTVKVCARCGSINVDPDFSVIGIKAAPSMYECKDCGFKSIGVVEIDEKDLRNFRRQLKRFKSEK